MLERDLASLMRLVPLDCRERRVMGVVIFIALTLAIFALLGLAQKLVEGL